MRKEHNTKILCVLFAATMVFSGCVSFDEYLDTVISNEPAVIFSCGVRMSERDTLLVMGVESENVISRFQYTSLKYYLRNTRGEFRIVSVAGRDVMNFLPFRQLSGENLNKFQLTFPALEEMDVFAVYLRKMTVDQKEVERINMLADGEMRNITYRNRKIIGEMRVVFIAAIPEEGEAEPYAKMGIHVFEPAGIR